MTLLTQLTRHKTVESLQAELGARKDFRRVLGVWQLTAIGLGGIIGVGIFVLAGQQAAMNAGPAVAISFIIAGVASAAAALAMPARMNDSATAGPALAAACWPASTKMPTPMMPPRPIAVSCHRPRTRRKSRR